MRGAIQKKTVSRTPSDSDNEVVFYTDAKATEEGACVGGFLQGAGGDITEWFSEEVKESWAPWLFVKGDPKRVIAALELLATLIAARLWARDLPKGGRGKCWVKGKTDNLRTHMQLANG